jgi:hypothetical protein
VRRFRRGLRCHFQAQCVDLGRVQAPGLERLLGRAVKKHPITLQYTDRASKTCINQPTNSAIYRARCVSIGANARRRRNTL